MIDNLTNELQIPHKCCGGVLGLRTSSYQQQSSTYKPPRLLTRVLVCDICGVFRPQKAHRTETSQLLGDLSTRSKVARCNLNITFSNVLQGQQQDILLDSAILGHSLCSYLFGRPACAV